MNKARIIAFFFFILSYVSLILILIFEKKIQKAEFPFFVIFWLIGSTNFIFNIYYAANLELKSWLLILFVISGLTWVFAPLLFTYFGIPSLIIYLFIGIYIHFSKPADFKPIKKSIN